MNFATRLDLTSNISRSASEPSPSTCPSCCRCRLKRPNSAKSLHPERESETKPKHPTASRWTRACKPQTSPASSPQVLSTLFSPSSIDLHHQSNQRNSNFLTNHDELPQKGSNSGHEAFTPRYAAPLRSDDSPHS